MLQRCTLILSLALLASCASQVTSAEALRLADAAMRQRGYDPALYKSPWICYNCPTQNDTWHVSYERKALRHEHTGDHISVVIDGTTRKIWGVLD
jgi:hypothetical protein